MPGYSRNLPAGCVVHVVNRGNDKRQLFEVARNYEEFLRLVLWSKSKCPVRIVAYCIMSNHWHFCFWVQIEWDVSAFLHHLTTTHAKRWRTRTGTVGCGHVYQDRFKATQVFSERHYYNVLRYIEQNPVRAGLVRNARDWQWSSVAERLGNGRGILDSDPVGLPADWIELVEELLPTSVNDEIQHSLKRY